MRQAFYRDNRARKRGHFGDHRLFNGVRDIFFVVLPDPDLFRGVVWGQVARPGDRIDQCRDMGSGELACRPDFLKFGHIVLEYGDQTRLFYGYNSTPFKVTTRIGKSARHIPN
jgi:hypothetical protein